MPGAEAQLEFVFICVHLWLVGLDEFQFAADHAELAESDRH
jgi:hypothetical protein